MEQDPFAVIEALTIAGFACGAETGFLYIRGEYPLATERLEHAIAEARRHGDLGEDVMGQRDRVRHRAPPWRRRLHLRRGDRAVQLARGQARGAAEQAAVPGDPRRLRQADGDQQRRDADQRPRGPPDRRRGVRRDRDRGIHGPPLVLPLRARRAARRLRGRARRDPSGADRAGGRRPSGAPPSRRSCSAARPAASSGRTCSTRSSRSRTRGRAATRSARA